MLAFTDLRELLDNRTPLVEPFYDGFGSRFWWDIENFICPAPPIAWFMIIPGQRHHLRTLA